MKPEITQIRWHQHPSRPANKRSGYTGNSHRGRPKQHLWRQVEFNPFSKNPLMRCVKCDLKERKQQIRRGGQGPCNPAKKGGEN